MDSLPVGLRVAPDLVEPLLASPPGRPIRRRCFRLGRCPMRSPSCKTSQMFRLFYFFLFYKRKKTKKKPNSCFTLAVSDPSRPLNHMISACCVIAAFLRCLGPVINVNAGPWTTSPARVSCFVPGRSWYFRH